MSGEEAQLVRMALRQIDSEWHACNTLNPMEQKAFQNVRRKLGKALAHLDPKDLIPD
jgi:hypothetical protein